MQALRKSIGIVMQEPILFNDTIKNNILYGNPHATDQMVYDAALQANALGFIELEEDLKDPAVQNSIENQFASK